jgi:hypothetical protein
MVLGADLRRYESSLPWFGIPILPQGYSERSENGILCIGWSSTPIEQGSKSFALQVVFSY